MLEVERMKFARTEFDMLQWFTKKDNAGSIPRPSDKDIEAAIADYLRRARDAAYHERHWADGDVHVGRRDLCVEQFDYYNMLIETDTTRASVNPARVEQWLNAQIAAGKMDETRAAQVRKNLSACRAAGDPLPIAMAERDALAYQTGRRFMDDDMARLDRLMLEAQREAWFAMEVDRQKTSALFGRVDVPETFPAAQRPFTTDALLAQQITSPPLEPESESSSQSSEFATNPQVQPTAMSLSLPPLQPVSVAQPPAAEWAALPSMPPAAEQDGMSPASVLQAPAADGSALSSQKWTIRQLVDKLIEEEYDKAGNTEASVQMRTFAKLLYHVMGTPEAPALSLQQSHIGAMMDLMNQLPARWGRTRDELAGGIPASLARAANLDPADVGVSAKTKAKHLTYLKKLIEFAPDYVLIAPLTVAPARRRIKKALQEQNQDRGRSNWTSEEVALLLDTPPFTGCFGPKRSDRYIAGPDFYHDSAYWMPIGLPVLGTRSSELAGLATEDVVVNAPIPYIWIRHNSFRRLKNRSSERMLPIPPELLRLGFAEFVLAVKATGSECLFPDLMPKTVTTDFASNYLKSFNFLRLLAFPDGTPSMAKIRGAQRQKDVHSYRGTCITALYDAGVAEPLIQAIVGHGADLADTLGINPQKEIKSNPMTKRYRTPVQMEKMLPVMFDSLDKLAPFTRHLIPFEICLNPTIYQVPGH